jgi:hypothetical protein
LHFVSPWNNPSQPSDLLIFTPSFHKHYVRFNSVGLWNFHRSFVVLVCTWILTCVPPWWLFHMPSNVLVTLSCLSDLVHFLFETYLLLHLAWPLSSDALRILSYLSVLVNEYLSSLYSLICSCISLDPILTCFWNAFICWILLKMTLSGAEQMN